MSRPRAATSVATSTDTWPALKSASARLRAPCVLSPWITAVRRPAPSRKRPTRSEPCLVRQKTSVWRSGPVVSTCASRSRFCSCGQAKTRCTTVEATTCSGATSMRTGSSEKVFEMAMISFDSVAERSSVWRLAGTVVMIRFSGGRKPMSSMRSASSSTTISMPDRSMVRRSRWSIRRPGVATTISTPRRRVRTCPMIGSPPTMVIERRRVAWLKSRRDSCTCSASSRVGTSTRPRGFGP